LTIDKEPAGFIAIEKSEKEEGIFYIEKLGVVPRYRHKGYGKKLMGFAAKRVRKLGGKKISIGIIDSNKKLKEWYKQLGFSINGTKNFDHLPFKVCFMEKNLR
jgi:ribosomal protein S18 acetylase RimI-like enzyme